MSEEGWARVTVFRQQDGLWRWRWMSGGDEDAALTSSHAVDSRAEAESGARSAYPGTPLVVIEPRARPRRRVRRAVGRLLVATLVAVCLVCRGRSARPRS